MGKSPHRTSLVHLLAGLCRGRKCPYACGICQQHAPPSTVLSGGGRAFQVRGDYGAGCWLIAEPLRPPFSARAAVGLPQPLGPSLVQEVGSMGGGGWTDPLKRDERAPKRKIYNGESWARGESKVSTSGRYPDTPTELCMQSPGTLGKVSLWAPRPGRASSPCPDAAFGCPRASPPSQRGLPCGSLAPAASGPLFS